MINIDARNLEYAQQLLGDTPKQIHTVKKYIAEQEKHDIALDKLSVKEYEDPFKGN